MCLEKKTKSRNEQSLRGSPLKMPTQTNERYIDDDNFPMR
jgi:hypothetical protein